MFRCTICGFEFTLDDTIVTTRRGTCICLRCYATRTDTGRSMPVLLRRQVSAAAGSE